MPSCSTIHSTAIMGSLCTVPFKTSEIPGQGPEVLKLAGEMGLTRTDINAMYRYYRKIDFDNSGTISVDEFIVVNSFSQEYLCQLVFKTFDENGDGNLTFFEFLYATWNYLTFSKATLTSFLFSIFDVDKSGNLSYEEVKFLVNLIWKFHPETHVLKVFLVLDENRDGSISSQEMLEFYKHNQMVFFPAFELQDVLRRMTLGISKWSELSSIREEHEKKHAKKIHIYETKAEILMKKSLNSTLKTIQKVEKSVDIPEKYRNLLLGGSVKRSNHKDSNHNKGHNPNDKSDTHDTQSHAAAVAVGHSDTQSGSRATKIKIDVGDHNQVTDIFEKPQGNKKHRNQKIHP